MRTLRLRTGAVSVLAGYAFFVCGTRARAAPVPVPDWAMTAARASQPDYPKDTKAVVLADDEVLTVEADGRAILHVRRAIKILRQQGRDYATVVIPVDKDRKLRVLHAWSIGRDGHPYTLKDNEVVETSAAEYGILYNDLHLKVAKLPAADPGAVVAYEYERTERPYVSEHTWDFQRDIPTLHASFELDLPAGWKHYEAARGTLGPPTEVAQNHFRWEVDHLAGIDTEEIPFTPSPETIAGRMVVHYSSVDLPAGAARWTAIGDWYSALADPRGEATPEITAKALALTAGETDFTDKLQSITTDIQRHIRYVGIEIGVGGLQPHAADDVFRNHYGDCKDKVTLLRAMLAAVGIHATWVLVDTRRGYVDPAVPSADGNHAIAAIELPPQFADSRLQSVVALKDGKRYLIFDPTDEYTPVGQIRPALQGSYGILTEGKQSALIQLPQLAPDADLLDRVAQCKLLPDGSLQAEVTEKRFGAASLASRRAFAEESEKAQREFLEKRLRPDLAHFDLGVAAAHNETRLDQDLVLTYSFTAPDYARTAGTLLLFRPRLLGTDALALKDEPRLYPIELGAVMRRRERYDVTLPTGYVVDELPEPLDLDTDFASYHSSVKVDGNTLHYAREYVVKQLKLEPGRYEELRKFTNQVAFDEASTAVLKKQ